jgi:GTPase
MDASVNRIKSAVDERAYLIAIKINENPIEVQQSLEELKLLVKTAGAVTVDSVILNRKNIDPSYVIGSGIVENLKSVIIEKKISLIVFDLNHIKPSQVRNLEEELKCRIVGRTEIILDIFAKRARSAESSIQVELAQLKYRLPRLKGLGSALSRTGGGIGTRGPGEKMLETDRRHLLQRISKLKNDLKKISGRRGILRKGRSNQVLGAVVGYTNAGKSTLINRLAKDDLFVEDRLFATLDSYTRSVYLEAGKKALITDTVGFIRNLPANLIDSFRSSLEEISNADFLIHVIDITSPSIDNNIRVVEQELADLNCAEKPCIFFFNKTDAGENNAVLGKYPDAVAGSATKNTGIDELKKRIIAEYNKCYKTTAFTTG